MKKPFRPIDRPSEASLPRVNTVHVVDDDEAVRRSLGVVLAAGGHACRSHSSVAEFLAEPDADQRGCIVIDIDKPGRDQLELRKRLKMLDVGLPVIVVTTRADVSLAVAAFKGGAFDFLEKGDTGRFLTAVAAALEWHDRGTGRHAAIELIQKRLRSLSNRERDVLDGLLAGHPNKEIARDLDVSPRTIEVYRAKVMLKMQAETLSELVRMALTSTDEVRTPSRENRR